jgi:GT2 family glycosyltransferase
MRATDTAVVGFLDDDAVFRGDPGTIAAAFADDPRLGAVSFRLVDEAGRSAARHVPRPGGRGADAEGPVAQFLGGASAIRRDAYDQVGGYFTDLHYGHEEIELCWRLIDAGWSIRYLADVEVFHPRTEISRHDDGWRLTGRNRVWIARRTLPWPVALVHVGLWLVLGTLRAPTARCRRQYVAGWWSGWRTQWTDGSRRRPISWRTVWELTRLGRPPVI